MPQNVYLCIGNGGKGSISRMSDECLMKGKSGSLYFYEYQAGTRKFTLAEKAGHSSECGKIRGKMQILREKFVPLQAILNE